MSDLFELMVNSASEITNHMMAQILENRFALLVEWAEPRPARDPTGNPISASVILRATVHDCINMQRAVVYQQNKPTMRNDANFLYDFMIIHQASIVQG